jgi:hypothetical protein
MHSKTKISSLFSSPDATTLRGKLEVAQQTRPGMTYLNQSMLLAEFENERRRLGKIYESFKEARKGGDPHHWRAKFFSDDDSQRFGALFELEAFDFFRHCNPIVEPEGESYPDLRLQCAPIDIEVTAVHDDPKQRSQEKRFGEVHIFLREWMHAHPGIQAEQITNVPEPLISFGKNTYLVDPQLLERLRQQATEHYSTPQNPDCADSFEFNEDGLSVRFHKQSQHSGYAGPSWTMREPPGKTLDRSIQDKMKDIGKNKRPCVLCVGQVGGSVISNSEIVARLRGKLAETENIPTTGSHPVLNSFPKNALGILLLSRWWNGEMDSFACSGEYLEIAPASNPLHKTIHEAVVLSRNESRSN